eukprot:m.467254 g.467254  ORF g.467254 m.467254 type:complete len:316 (+) comp21636_c1_seq2:280-1227(+)
MQAFKNKMEQRSGTLVTKSTTSASATDSRRESAAVVLQAAWRGHATRKKLHPEPSPPTKRSPRKKGPGRGRKKQHATKPSRRARPSQAPRTSKRSPGGMTTDEAATVIQSTWRRHHQRTTQAPGRSTVPSHAGTGTTVTNPRALLHVERIPTPDLSVTADERAEVEHSAATTIQRTFRGHQARRALQQQGVRVRPPAIAVDTDAHARGEARGPPTGKPAKNSTKRKKQSKATDKSRPGPSSPSPLSSQQSFSGKTSKVRPRWPTVVHALCSYLCWPSVAHGYPSPLLLFVLSRPRYRCPGTGWCPRLTEVGLCFR